jgi:hypothetical protein
MKPHFDLIETNFNTSYAPLCVLGHALRQRRELEKLTEFDAILKKKRDHSVGEKLQDAFLLILAGYPSLYLLNTTLRADPMLARAWGRAALAEQSTISRTLDAFSQEAVACLRETGWDFWQEHSQLPNHDWRKRLVLDLDLTPLLASASAEDSTKGYLGEKTQWAGNWLG